MWGHEHNYTAKIRKPPTPQPELFSLEEEPGGGPPAPLSEVAGRQEKVERHFVEHLAEFAPVVQILDAPVPQMDGDVTDTLRILDFPVAEQVNDVPKISCSPCPSRSLVPEPQSAEQLVEVPTVLSPTRIALRIAEQIVDTPVPRGRGQGFLPEQSSTAISSSGTRTFERTEEQMVDISPGGGLDQGSSSSARPADEEFYWVFFALFPIFFKCEAGFALDPPVAAHPRRLLSWRVHPCRTPSGNRHVASLAASGCFPLQGCLVSSSPTLRRLRMRSWETCLSSLRGPAGWATT